MKPPCRKKGYTNDDLRKKWAVGIFTSTLLGVLALCLIITALLPEAQKVEVTPTRFPHNFLFLIFVLGADSSNGRCPPRVPDISIHRYRCRIRSPSFLKFSGQRELKELDSAKWFLVLHNFWEKIQNLTNGKLRHYTKSTPNDNGPVLFSNDINLVLGPTSRSAGEQHAKQGTSTNLTELPTISARAKWKPKSLQQFPCLTLFMQEKWLRKERFCFCGRVIMCGLHSSRK